MSQEQLGKHVMHCFTHVTHHMCVFNMVCAGVWECNCMPFPFRPVYIITSIAYCQPLPMHCLQNTLSTTQYPNNNKNMPCYLTPPGLEHRPQWQNLGALPILFTWYLSELLPLLIFHWWNHLHWTLWFNLHTVPWDACNCMCMLKHLCKWVYVCNLWHAQNILFSIYILSLVYISGKEKFFIEHYM